MAHSLIAEQIPPWCIWSLWRLYKTRSMAWAASSLFTVDRHQLIRGRQTVLASLSASGNVFLYANFPPPPFWAVLMSTHEIVTAPLGLMNPYNCCTNILNLIACNVVNTQSSLPIRGALAEIIQNSGKSKIIYVRLWRPTFDAGQLNHLCNSILFKLGGTLFSFETKKHGLMGEKGWQIFWVLVKAGTWSFQPIATFG